MHAVCLYRYNSVSVLLYYTDITKYLTDITKYLYCLTAGMLLDIKCMKQLNINAVRMLTYADVC
jgi:hypothetical protein